MPRLKISVGGAGPLEPWSVSAEFSLGATIPDLATLQTIVNAAFTTLNGSTAYKAGVSTDCFTAVVKGLYYATNVEPVSLVAESAGTPFAGTAVASHPPQVCVVASLRTNLPGRSFRGRQYWPYRISAITTTGAVNTTGQATIAAASQALASAVIAAAASSGIAATWCVYSTVKNTLTAITSVQVGTQCDTQRRRNVNRNETYSSTPVTVTSIPFDAGGPLASSLQTAVSEFVPVAKDIVGGIVNVAPLIELAAE